MSQVFTGSKASFKINGIKVVFVSSITVNEDDQLTDIDVLDQLQVAELAETGHKVNFTVNVFKVDQNAAELIGVRPTNVDDILRQPTLTCEIYDRISDEVRYTIQGVKFAGGSGSVDARGVWQGTWNFRGQVGGGSL